MRESKRVCHALETELSKSRLVAVLLSLGGICICGCDAGYQQPASRDAQAKAVEAQPETFKVGQRVPGRYFEITVNEVQQVPDIVVAGLFKKDAGPGNAFLVIDVTVKNIDGESRRFIEGDLFVDVQGKQFKFDNSESFAGEGYLGGKALNPLTTARGKVVFTVPSGLRGPAYWVPGRDSKRIALPLTGEDVAVAAAAAPTGGASAKAALNESVVFKPERKRDVACFKRTTAMEHVTLVGTLSEVAMRGARTIVTSSTRGAILLDLPNSGAGANAIDDMRRGSARVAVTGTILTSCSQEQLRDTSNMCWSFEMTNEVSVRRLPESDSLSEVARRLPIPQESAASLARPMDVRYEADFDTVRDKSTSLIWHRCVEGKKWTGSSCEGKPEEFSVEDAEKYAGRAASESGQDWRIPSKQELQSLLSKKRKCPAIDVAAFGANAEDFVMSKQPQPHLCCQSFEGVDFGSGEARSSFADAGALRLVRTAEPSGK